MISYDDLPVPGEGGEDVPQEAAEDPVTVLRLELRRAEASQIGYRQDRDRADRLLLGDLSAEERAEVLLRRDTADARLLDACGSCEFLRVRLRLAERQVARSREPK